MSRNMLMIQQQRYQEQQEHSSATGSPCRNGNARAILSSTPDVFGDEEEDVSEGDEVYSVDCGQSGSPVDLYVSNLDYNISSREWRKILASTFQPHVQVLGIFVRTQPDNTSLAVVKVPTLEDARFAISQFHRRKIGYKRIHVSLRNDGDQVPAESTRQESVSVLSDAKDYVMPVFKFIEQYEKRFHKSVSVSDLYKMKDVVEIIDRGGTGRMVRLSPGVCPTPTPQLENAPETALVSISVEIKVSQIGTKVIHFQENKEPPGAERVLARQFDITHYGVAFLEDLFMDIPPTSILITLEGNKTIMAIPKRDQTPEEMERTKQFALEVVDLLKHNPMCRMAFNKFIPAYHHHFGRQCRVADYGFTKLTDLFECISQVVEILEDQEERMLKLTAPEMRAVLSEQIVGLVREYPGQCLPVSQLMLAFQRQYGFPLCLVDYGVNSVIALLGKIKHCVSLLMDQSGGCLPLVELCSRYKSTFSVELDVHKVQDELSEYVQCMRTDVEDEELMHLDLQVNSRPRVPTQLKFLSSLLKMSVRLVMHLL
nr:hypothetical protein BaRGS_032653 [Batillaria attramentaria]